MHRRLGGQSGAFGGVHDGRAERRPSVGTGSYPVRQWAFYLRFCLPAMAAAAAIVPSGKPPVGRRHAWCEGSRIYCGVSRVSRRRQTPGQHRRSARAPVLTAAVGPSRWPCGPETRRLATMDGPSSSRARGGALGSLPQVTRGSPQQPTTPPPGLVVEAAPVGPSCRDDPTFGGGRPGVRRSRTMWDVIKIQSPERLMNFRQPSRAAAPLAALDSPPRRTGPGDDGRSLPRNPSNLVGDFRTRGLKIVTLP